MVTGKSNLFCLLTLLSNQEEHILSQTDTQTAQIAKLANAGPSALRVFHMSKLQEMTYADIHVSRTVVGKKENTLEYTETSR